MLLYDGKSDIDWFYGDHPTTAAAMAEDPRTADLTRVPCVLFDDGAGRVYRWQRLDALCAGWGVELADGVAAASDEARAALDAVAAAMAVPPADLSAKVDELASSLGEEKTSLSSLKETVEALSGVVDTVKSMLHISS